MVGRATKVAVADLVNMVVIWAAISLRGASGKEYPTEGIDRKRAGAARGGQAEAGAGAGRAQGAKAQGR